MQIKLTRAEIDTGMMHEKLIIEAQVLLNERMQAQARYTDHLRANHDAPTSKYVLANWIDGFVEKSETETKT